LRGGTETPAFKGGERIPDRSGRFEGYGQRKNEALDPQHTTQPNRYGFEQEYPEAAEARNHLGLRNVGLFTAEPGIFEPLQEYKDKVFTQLPRYKNWQKEMAACGNDKPDIKEPEFGFADLMKLLPKRGEEVISAHLALPNDRLNVNSSKDVQKVIELVQERTPFVRILVEKTPDRSEVYVKFIDLDKNHEVVEWGGAAHLRNCKRFRFPEGTDLNSKMVETEIQEHIKTISGSLAAELGVEVSDSSR